MQLTKTFFLTTEKRNQFLWRRLGDWCWLSLYSKWIRYTSTLAAHFFLLVGLYYFWYTLMLHFQFLRVFHHKVQHRPPKGLVWCRVLGLCFYKTNKQTTITKKFGGKILVRKFFSLDFSCLVWQINIRMRRYPHSMRS